jgi:hypothetical protein
MRLWWALDRAGVQWANPIFCFDQRPSFPMNRKAKLQTLLLRFSLVHPFFDYLFNTFPITKLIGLSTYTRKTICIAMTF